MSAQPSETPVLDLLEVMTLASLDASGLDPQTLMLVRLAALIAVDAPPTSYMLNIGAAAQIGVSAQNARDVLAAVAPIVGTVRTVSALSNIALGLSLAVDLIELDDAGMS
jgi:4-carboxymuconolactone decarboxylase